MSAPLPIVPDEFFENVCLLASLTDRPSEQTANKLPDDPVNGLSTSTILSLRQETAICGHFAYISSVTDDPAQVTAVCIEESSGNEHTPGMTIWLARNSGSLKVLQDDLGRVTTILTQIYKGRQRASAAEKSDLAEEVLMKIIALTSFRILQRLGSRHAPSVKHRGVVKNLPIERLMEVLDLCRRYSLWTRNNEAFELTSSACRRMRSAFVRIESLSKEEAFASEGALLIRSLISESRSVVANLNLEALLRGFPEPRKPPWPHDNERDKLQGIISKLARYHEVWEDLVRLASRLRVFRTIRVATVPEMGDSILPSRSVSHESMAHNAMFYEETCARVFQSDSHVLTQYRPRPRRSISIRDSFVRRYRNVQDACRVHAEIKHLVHCLTFLAPRIRPRVVTATKGACFLCNKFLSLHGGLHVPSTHGKLHEQWSLPELNTTVIPEQEINRISNVIERMTGTLATSIKDVCRLPKVRLPDVNESEIWDKPDYTNPPSIISTVHSTIHSTVTSAISSVPGVVHTVGDVEHHRDRARSSSRSTVMREPLSDDELRGRQLQTSDPTFKEIFSNVEDVVRSTRLAATSIDIETLAMHEWYWTPLSSGSEALRLRIGGFCLAIAHDFPLDARHDGDSNAEPSFGKRRCWVRVRYETPSEDDARFDGSKVVDVGDLWRDAIVTTAGAAHADTELILRHGRSVVRLKYALD